ncbi:hypothetical protein [Ideonella sp.]|uniref:hypothetical protein n=1 Tax=Ideonella sp. TaxID=1929293 RepID=UPI0035AEC750
MTLADLVAEFVATRSPGWLVLTEAEAAECAVAALRFYAAHGFVASLVVVDPDGLPVDTSIDLRLIHLAVDLTTGEWSIVRPLFALYVEREQALRLEASRAAGLDVYGRPVSEIAGDIALMEGSDGVPSRAFAAAAVTVE